VERRKKLMFTQRGLRIFCFVLALLVVSLSCDAPAGAKPEVEQPRGEEGAVPESDEEAAEAPPDEAPPAQEPETGGGEGQGEGQGFQFSLEDCSCTGVSTTLDTGASKATDSNYRMSILSGGEVEVAGSLNCEWIDPYQSEQKTGTIRIYLELYRFESETYAHALFTEHKNDILQMPGYCQDDQGRCTVALTDFGEARAFYAQKTIYIRGDGVEFPSTHSASMARMITTPNGHFAFNLLVDHPELDKGSSWVIDTAQTVEACIEAVVNR
jgi:hypothetical protein